MSIEIIVSIISGILAGGITPLLYFRQDRNHKNIENESLQSEEWKKLYDEAKEKLNKVDDEINSLYTQLYAQKDEETAILKKMADLEVRHTKCNLLMCEVPGCPNRKPQTGY